MKKNGLFKAARLRPDSVYHRLQLARGPKIVAIGGGTGLPVLLRGLKQYTNNITAVVTVTDDGGSSGRLRSELGLLPPGDIRNCLVALAEAEPLMQQLFQYRFPSGSELAGHSFGNMFIAAMCGVTGDFLESIRESGRVLAVRGKVLPSTLDNVELVAEMADGRVVRGETSISSAGGRISRLSLIPPDNVPLDEVIADIGQADAIVLGPGSLFTSVMPNLLVNGVAEAIAASRAIVIYVCNIMTEHGETDDFTASDHVKAIIHNVGFKLIDVVLVNVAPVKAALLTKYELERSKPVVVDRHAFAKLNIDLVQADVLGKNGLAWHDSNKLGREIIRIINRRKRWHTKERRSD